MEMAQAGLLAVNLFWTTLCLGGYRPETMVITSALTGAVLALHLLTRAIFPDGTSRAHPAGWIFLPFLVYAAANVVWVTPVRWLGWHDWLWWAQMTAVFWVVLNGVRAAAARRLLLGALVLAGFIAVALAAYQFFVRPDWLMLGRRQADQFIGRASGPFGIPNSLAALLLLLLPPTVAFTLSRNATAVQRVLAGYLAMVFATGLIFTASRGAWIGLALAAVAWPLLAGRRSWSRRLGRTALVGLTALAVGVVIYLTLPNMRARFDALVQDAGEKTRPIMWRGAWRLFLESPVAGSGAGSYNVSFEKYRPEHYQLDSQWAHNDYLNTLSDYGAVGFGLFFGACALVVGVSVRRAREAAGARVADAAAPPGWLDDVRLRRAMVLGVLAFGLQLFVDFHFKIPALAMALAIVAGMLVQRSWPLAASTGEKRTLPAVRLACALVALAVIALWLAAVGPHYRAEALRYSARQSLDRLERLEADAYPTVLTPAKTALAQAVAIDPGNAQAWADLAYATALEAHVDPSRTNDRGRAAEAYADRALALSGSVAEFWLRRTVALDMQSRWLEAGDNLVHAMQLAPAQATVWYYQAYHLSLNPVTRLQARAAVAICLRLDPANRQAQVLRQQLATGQ